MRRIFFTTVLFLLFIVSAVHAYDVNKDLTNKGPVADDIAVILSGQENVTAHYDGYLTGSKKGRFYSFSDGPEGPNTKLHWQNFKDGDNDRIDTGQTIHVGWSTADHNCKILDMYWTDPKGNRIPGSVVHNITSGWTYKTGSDYVEVSWENVFDGTVYIENVHFAVIQEPIPLENLNYENVYLEEVLQPLPGGELIKLASGDTVVRPLFSSGLSEDAYIVLRYHVVSENSAAFSTDFIQFQLSEESSVVSLTSFEDWALALETGTVRPLTKEQWYNYMEQWYSSGSIVINKPYPDTSFQPATLYPWDGTYPWVDLKTGLVMSWGDPDIMIEGNPYASAWTYNPEGGMDLTDAKISITVFPPDGIEVISFGLMDIYGNMRSWYWNVGQQLPSGVDTQITIKPSLYMEATDPFPAAFMTSIAFDISNVVLVMFDENGRWVAETQLPPPGTNTPKIWNYWRDMIINF